MDIKLRIENAESFVKLLVLMKANGLLKGMPNDVSFDDEMFPLDLALNVEKLIGMIGNPVVRKIFGKRIDTTLMAHLEQIIEA